MLRIAWNYDLALVSITPRLQIAQNCDSHFCSLVLDWTIRTSLFIGLHFKLETGPFFSQTGLYFSVQTAVPILWTVRSGLLERSPKKATVRTGPDRGQSI